MNCRTAILPPECRGEDCFSVMAYYLEAACSAAIYLTKPIRITAISARVAVPFGTRVVAVLPLTRPFSTAQA